ncbi:MAG: AAA family ATPase [Bacteroidaceae bacterium]|nr:AAA family ATPase [Bacteroidaceae bacterium]
MRLWENSLGFNNLIYIATVLSDIKESHDEDPTSVYILLIEEPEAHLHPQLQVNLYNFIRNADENENTQVFITSHSPTLTSKIPLENLILLKDNESFTISNCFINRAKENIISDTNTNKKLDDEKANYYKNMITRYLDVTRSQLFFSKGCLFLEGISEALMVNTFSKLINKTLIDNEIEIINISGTAFYQFIMLCNSTNATKRLPLKMAFITDEDQFTDSKKTEYKIDELIKDNYKKLNELKISIQKGVQNRRIANMKSMANNNDEIKIASGQKTLEYQICKANVFEEKDKTKNTSLHQLLDTLNHDDIIKADAYVDTIKGTMNDDEQMNAAILYWKCTQIKSEFAQKLTDFLEESLKKKRVNFTVPLYIQDAINHLVI